MVKRTEAGYTLVALAVAVTILSVMVAVAMPVWKQVIQRDKEEEMIFRGWQYAEAIRVFQQRHGRLPTRLDELMKVKPRSIRQLWKDPMTKNGEWGLIFQGQQNLNQSQKLTPDSGLAGATQGEDENGRGGSGGPTGQTGQGKQPQRVGPIVGVRSLSTESSIKMLFGEQEYDRWTFTIQALSGNSGNANLTGINPSGVQQNGRLRVYNPGGLPNIPQPRWIGRPFRQGLTPPGGGLAPGLVNGSGLGKTPSGGPPGTPPNTTRRPSAQ